MPPETWLGMRVHDWDHAPLGTVTAAAAIPGTDIAQSVTVSLDPAVAARAGTAELVVPMNRVFGLRHRRLVLDATLEELLRPPRPPRPRRAPPRPPAMTDIPAS